MKKNKLLIVIGAVVLTAIIVTLFRSRQSAADKIIRIGANLSLTGSMPYWSNQIKNGMDLALEKFASNDIQIRYEDNQGNAKGAISAFRKLSGENVCAVVTAHTSIAVPQQVLADKVGIPLLGTVVGVSDFGEKNRWSFLDWPAHEDVVPPLVAYMTQKLRCKRAAILVVNDDYGSTGAKVFSAKFSEAGGVISGSESIANTEKDLRPILSKLLVNGVDSLYTITREETLLNVIKQSREMGFSGYIVGDHAMASSVIDKGLPDNISGIAFCGSAGIVEIEKAAPDFVSDYMKKYGDKPDWVALYGYSLAEYLIDAVRKTNGDKDKLRDSLSLVDMDTIRGHVRMAANRKINTACVVYVREAGRFVIAQ